MQIKSNTFKHRLKSAQKSTRRSSGKFNYTPLNLETTASTRYTVNSPTNYDGLAKSIAQLTPHFSPDHDFYSQQADYHRKAGQLYKATLYYIEAANQGSGASASINLACCYILMENYKQAVQVLEGVDEYLDIKCYNLALAYYMWGKYDKAQEYASQELFDDELRGKCCTIIKACWRKVLGDPKTYNRPWKHSRICNTANASFAKPQQFEQGPKLYKYFVKVDEAPSIKRTSPEIPVWTKNRPQSVQMGRQKRLHIQDKRPSNVFFETYQSIEQSDLQSTPVSQGKAQSSVQTPKLDRQGVIVEDLPEIQLKKQMQKAKEELLKQKFVKKSLQTKQLAEKPARQLYQEIQLDMQMIPQKNINVLLQEFKKPPEERDVKVIDSILAHLQFLINFDKQTRYQIYKIGEIMITSPQNVLCKQGDIGDEIYCVLKGSVGIRKKAAQFCDMDLQIGTQYDGSQLGELAVYSSELSQQAQKRRATVYSIEHSVIMRVPQYKYSFILQRIMRNDISIKVNFLELVPLFFGVLSTDLIPIATNIEVRHYSNQDILLKAGQKSEGLYIIVEGCCDVVIQGYCIKSKFEQGVAMKRKKKPPKDGFYFGHNSKPVENQEKRKEIERNDPMTEALWYNRNQEFKHLPNDVNQFITQKQMQKMTTDDYIVKESMIKATLFPKNYFGGRALLLPNIKRIPGGKSWKSKPALFSVVARSHAVKIFLITNKTIQYASDELVKRLRYVIQNSYEEDSPEGVTLKQLHRIFRQWQHKKRKCVENTRREAFVRRYGNKNL